MNLIGPHASGKSTLSRALVGPQAVEHAFRLDNERVTYTLGEDIALAGNLKNGSDAIRTMEAQDAVIERCWRERNTVIVDPVRCSMKFIDEVLRYTKPLTALFVYIDISLEENVKRLMQRRRDNGEIEEALPAKTYENLLAVRDRAERVWQHCCTAYKRPPYLLCSLPEDYSTEQCAAYVRRALESLRGASEQKEAREFNAADTARA